MNNNREERLQMRQRGAATRKIKEVDFGFSFGLAPPEDPQPASQSELANGPPAPSAPSEPESSQPPLASEKQNTPPSWSQSSVQRTPGSARNALPERPSTFDIPADEAPSLGRSSKRRKIESPPTSRRVSPRRDGTLQGQKSSSPLRNGARSSPPVPPPNESIEAPTITNVTENENQPTETIATSATAKDAQAGSPPDVPESAPKSALENTTEPVSEPAPEPALEEPSEELIRKSPEQQSVHAPEPSPEQLPHSVLNLTDVAITEPELELGGEPDSNQAQPKSPLTQQAAPQPNGTSSPADSTRSKRKRGTSADERSSPSASPRPASESTQQVPRIPTPEQPVDASIAAEGKRRGASTRARSSQSASPKILDQDIQPPAPDPEEPPDAPTDKRTTRGASASGRPSKSASPRSVGESVQQPPQAATLDQPLETSTSKGKTRGASAGTRSTQSGSPDIGGEASQQAKQAPQTEESQKATRGKRKRRGSSASRRSPQSAIALETAEETQHPPPEEPQDTPMEAEPSELQPAKRRGRPQGSTQRSPVSGEDADAAAAPPVDKSAKEPSPPRREPRGLRNRNTKKAMPQVAAQEEEGPVSEPAQVEGASEANAPNHEEGRQPRQKLKTADKKSRRAGRGDKKAQAEEMSEEVPRPGRKGKTARKTQEPEPEPERAPERQPEVEPEAEPEPAPESQPEPSTRKRGRGKPSQSKRDSQATQPEERATQDNVEETAAPRPQRKPRQPRGETVPVTVHRLANVASLGGALPGTSSDEDEDEDDQETTEELSTRLKAKLPNRGGVNVADVLSQICRETLEKTLTTLNNGIANEGNAARRSEWTRKKKAVEAYSTELEGRLFELSEMLDSNFVLGVQLRKAKREMLDQRTRLFRLRKEREAVALRMDAVRQKHTEEENARATRSTINHSLHNIDLALERNKLHQPAPADSSASQNPSSSSPSVGLEFLLRSVAENASSRAPGAQGGLLSQIRAFNAQLESTAQKLES